ncbi:MULTISPECIES: hypothetical protein [Vibrio harveyi group]|uniref:hypothetical protein n=1 Tax=Vibrio harveyi group TaxID=717610 RepID=UPI001EEA02BC|nr:MULTISPECIES: hypothetical protein [Vibrio harveyi group]MCG6451646.1 hypothetical protein [Vibrio parahaemolyticus]MCR9988668.1 hypothetical protein [Vibrio antiquarius]
MERITLNYSLWYHQNRFYKVEKGQGIILTHDELADLFEAKRIYVTAVYKGMLRG